MFLDKESDVVTTFVLKKSGEKAILSTGFKMAEYGSCLSKPMGLQVYFKYFIGKG
jgi:hypothetical protein